jgi:digeranylgeranylglycerophospholipid reductase
MAPSESYEVIVVGGGIAGCFAAATASQAGADVVQLERKPQEKGGYIACGDAIKSPTDPKKYPGPIDMAAIASDERVLADGNIEQIEWWDEDLGVKKVIPYPDSSQVIDRYEFGQLLLEQSADLGVTQHYNTVVNGVIQNDRVTGIEAIRDGEPVTYHGDVVVDAAGAQSILQDKIDFDALDATFEEPHYTHFGSAYREIVETEEPVEYHNAIVGKPLEEMGYIWYFPRTKQTINVGLGFQMNKDPVPMTGRLKEDMKERPEFENATVDEKFDKKNKLGAALALRRPLDSMVAPGYLAAGGAAATTHPISGKGIRGAAISGYSAGKTAADAVANGDVSEAGLWGHNYYLFIENGEGANLASRDPFNVAASKAGSAEMRAVAALLPQAELREIVGTEAKIDDFRSKLSVGIGVLKNYISESRAGTFDQLGISIGDLYESLKGFKTTKDYVDEYEEHYGAYPDSPDGFDDWVSRRDAIDEAFYDALDLDAGDRKY